jgi:hypothetical protein
VKWTIQTGYVLPSVALHHGSVFNGCRRSNIFDQKSVSCFLDFMEASSGSVDGLKIDYVPVGAVSIVLMQPSTKWLS